MGRAPLWTVDWTGHASSIRACPFTQGLAHRADGGMACWLDKQIRAMTAGISLTASVSRWFKLFTGDWLGSPAQILIEQMGEAYLLENLSKEGARPIHSMGRLVSGSGHIFDTCTIDRGGKREEACSESPCRVIGWDGDWICGRQRSERGFQNMLFWLYPWRQGGFVVFSWLNRSVRIERMIGAGPNPSAKTVPERPFYFYFYFWKLKTRAPRTKKKKK